MSISVENDESENGIHAQTSDKAKIWCEVKRDPSDTKTATSMSSETHLKATWAWFEAEIRNIEWVVTDWAINRFLLNKFGSAVLEIVFIKKVVCRHFQSLYILCKWSHEVRTSPTKRCSVPVAT